MKYKKQYFEVVNYLKNKMDIDVIQIPGCDDAWYPMLNKIYINSNLKYRERLYTILHEAGHAIIDKNIDIKNKLCFKNSPANIKSRKSFVATLNEEIMAWNYGKEIADCLGFNLEDTIYESYMTDAIMSYVRKGLNTVYGKSINANTIKTYYV